MYIDSLPKPSPGIRDRAVQLFNRNIADWTPVCQDTFARWIGIIQVVVQVTPDGLVVRQVPGARRIDQPIIVNGCLARVYHGEASLV